MLHRLRWKNHEDGFVVFQKIVNELFYKTPYIIGIPQAILNFLVLCSVILITRHPLLALKSNNTIKGSRPKHIVPR